LRARDPHVRGSSPLDCTRMSAISRAWFPFPSDQGLTHPSRWCMRTATSWSG
jgi:hypothetical protein